FGPENIHIESVPNEGTTWTLRFQKPVKGVDKWYVKLERRFNEFKRLSESYTIGAATSRTEVIAYIWQLRKIEIFLFDLILQFSKYHNIRSIYRVVLSYFMEKISRQRLEAEFENYRCDNQQLKHMFLETTLDIRRRLDHLWERVDIDRFKGALFKSYGQAIENVMIFTLDPESGNFLATDRKLAEHLDFAPYLGKEREQLVRGEFIGDMNNHNQPIFFGVWSIVSDEDLINKLKLMQKAARRLLEMGIHQDKKLSFYQTTYVQHTADVDSDASTTFGEFVELSEEELRRFTRETAEEDMLGFILYQD
ncbi:MAG: histidine kinase, partial [Spirochaetota bacterium]